MKSSSTVFWTSLSSEKTFLRAASKTANYFCNSVQDVRITTLQTGWTGLTGFLIQKNIILCMSNLITHRGAARFVLPELDLPWLCGQSSR